MKLSPYEPDQTGHPRISISAPPKREQPPIYRGCHRKRSLKKAALKNFVTLGKQTPALESPFNKVASCKVRPAASLKRDPNMGVFL